MSVATVRPLFSATAVEIRFPSESSDIFFLATLRPPCDAISMLIPFQQTPSNSMADPKLRSYLTSRRSRFKHSNDLCSLLSYEMAFCGVITS